MSEAASGGRVPGERRGGGEPGAWSAATDPVGQSPGAQSPGAQSPGTEPPGTEPDEAQPVIKLVSGQLSEGNRPESRAPARSRDAGRAAGRDAGRAAGREVGRPASQPARRARPDSRRPDAPAGDLLTGVQRWLIRSGAKSMRREIEGQVRRTFGTGRAEPGDVWGTATTEPPPDFGESPECAWCPICRAARRMRESGPGLGSQISGASDVVASAVQDAIVAVDAVLSRTAAPGHEPPADRSPGPGHADSASDEAERAADEPGDRG